MILVSVFGGAELERYLLPVIPIFYIAVSVALTYQRRRISAVVIPVMLVGLVANIYYNPPYPFPFENNLAMVDFVHLQQVGASFAEKNLKQQRIATAWPYTAALRNPDFGYVTKKLRVVETGDFHVQSIRNLDPHSFDALVVYTRTWDPQDGALSFPLVGRFLNHFYAWEPQITSAQCADLGLQEAVSWESRGQKISVYLRH